MNINGHDIGVCSWSLQPRGMEDLVAKVHSLELEHIQLGLLDLVMLDDKRKYLELGHLNHSGLKITATMISFPGEDYSSIAIIRDTGGYVPDKEWPLRKQLTIQAAKLTSELGVKWLTTHIGFVPPSSHEKYEVMITRVREIAAALGELGLELLMETGQEEDTELLQFLNDLAVRNVHINFDPANMILYGAGDPIEAVQTLGRHIRHVHIKDGTLSKQPGVIWGEEVPFGAGQVGPRRFFNALKSAGYTGPLVIEREAGNNRVEDVKTAIEAIRAAG
ncbi:MAG TPA: sugar phosphate isomerase/epimerase family protein [Tepidisphaeraceae bacterium]|jgi:sugar phosphate isomerase/epimerase|nr:sugar phosphate isomerase/epimerase family protein [Tepidisphaeraceae bacterium]